MKTKIAQILLRLKAVTISTNPPYKWASGILSPIYTDNRIIMSYPKEREDVIKSFIKLIKNNKIKFDGFAGTATAGIPWASFLAQKTKKPMVYARKPKEHGKENSIEGVIEKGKKYVVVEDLVSTGESSINTVNAVRSQKGIVENCIAIFTYQLEKSKANFESAGCRLFTLTDFTNLVKTALNKKYISRAQLRVIMEWKKNPEVWVAV